jgi:PAN domain-containing protein
MRLAFRTLAVFIVLSLVLCGTSSADVPLLSPESPEFDVDRFGMDLMPGIPLSAADPALCRIECTDHPDCAAWTYVKPGVQGPSAMCYLKSGVPTPVSNTCCISGVYSKLSADEFFRPARGGFHQLSPARAIVGSLSQVMLF